MFVDHCVRVGVVDFLVAASADWQDRSCFQPELGWQYGVDCVQVDQVGPVDAGEAVIFEAFFFLGDVSVDFIGSMFFVDFQFSSVGFNVLDVSRREGFAHSLGLDGIDGLFRFGCVFADSGKDFPEVFFGYGFQEEVVYVQLITGDCIFQKGGHEDDFHLLVLLPDLSAGFDSVEAFHADIQKQEAEYFPLGDGVEEFLAGGVVYDFHLWFFECLEVFLYFFFLLYFIITDCYSHLYLLKVWVSVQLIVLYTILTF